MTCRIGLVVNPIAGMGGAVGLKGTDGMLEEALRRGATPRSHARAVAFLRALPEDVTLLSAGGAMGDDACAEADVSALVVYTPEEPPTAADTRAATKALAAAGIDVLVFVGGDGTAADVAAALAPPRRQGADEAHQDANEAHQDASSASDVAAALAPPDAAPAALGIPAGVKMYSAVFADTPQAAARVVTETAQTELREVLDIDEVAFRKGELRVALKGALRVPVHPRVQGGKMAGEDDDVEQETLGPAVVELLEPGRVYVLGAGATMLAVKRALGVNGSLLGLDVVRVGEADKEGELLVADADEEALLQIDEPFGIVLSPIGAQGFFLGRGNLPLTPAVLRRLRVPEDVVVVATPSKLMLTPTLKVDSGDPDIDRLFPKFLSVATGFGQTKLMRVTG